MLPFVLRLQLYLFFFSYASGVRRDLHSFPTRRSSDLFLMFDSMRKTCKLGRRIFSGKPGNPAPVPTSASRDRKSTRLNSSHTVISYAVFCLKKKKAASQPPCEIAQQAHIHCHTETPLR